MGKKFPGKSQSIVLLLLLALVALRVLAMRHYRVDSDEPQHLHVVWGWAHHLVQYRDVFDNHSPLFHLVSLPFYHWIGERPETLLFMRFLMAPLFFWCLWCVYRLGTLIKSREVGTWGAIFAALTPAFCYTFTEYRADDLWTAFWFAFLVVLLGGRWSAARGFLAGLLLGAALATSLKTLALVGCLGGAALIGLYLTGALKNVLLERRTWARMAALLAGGVILPGLLMLWFRYQNAWTEAVYGIFTYNSAPGLGRIRIRRDLVIGLLEFIGAGTALIYFARWAARRFIDPEKQFRFHLLLIGSGLYGALIYTLWPLLDAEHLIPFQPLLVLGLTPLLLELAAKAVRFPGPVARTAILGSAALVVIAVEAWTLRHDDVKSSLNRSAELLRLSDPADFVMDLKGETIFRPRPCRYLFEGIGIYRAKKGQTPDDIPERLRATGTCIVIRPNYRFVFPRAMAFMDENYINVGNFRVLGHEMKPAPEGGSFRFDTVIPQTFSFVSSRESVIGTIDGKPCPGYATLAPGKHEFVPSTPHSAMAFVWKQAIDREMFPAYLRAE